MIIELHHNDGTAEFREIARTELIAPLVIEDQGKFFIKTPCDPRICTTVAKYLLYKECRGEVLSNTAILRPSNFAEVAA